MIIFARLVINNKCWLHKRA